MEKSELVQSLPKDVKRAFASWIRESRFDIGVELKGDALDEKIGFFLKECGYDLSSKYQAEWDGAVIKMVSEDDKTYYLRLDTGTFPEIESNRYWEGMNEEYTCSFNERLEVVERILEYSRFLDSMRVIQTPDSYEVHYSNFNPRRKTTVEIAGLPDELKNCNLKDIMVDVISKSLISDDFFGTLSGLSEIPWFNPKDISTIWIFETRGFGEPEQCLALQHGKPKRFDLITPNRRITYEDKNAICGDSSETLDEEKKTWKLKSTVGDFSVSKTEGDGEAKYSHHWGGFTLADYERSLDRKKEIEMCQQEVDSAVKTFQKIFVPKDCN